MRLIDADKLLDEKKMHLYYHLPNGDVAIPVIDIEHAQTVGEWISVKDRMPDGNGKIYEGCLEESGTVLVYGVSCFDNKSYGTGNYIRDHNDKTECWNGVMDDCELYQCKVTHWMPLPEAPKEDAND